MMPSTATHGESVHGKFNHGKATKEYNCWQKLKQRCSNPNKPGSEHYLGRGITVCDRWKNSYELFLKDMGRCPKGMSIERINNDLGYSPENCKWATWKEQNNNKRNNRRLTCGGITKTMAQWAEYFGINPAVIKYRLKHGWPVEKAITVPLYPCQTHNQYRNHEPAH